MQTFQQHKKKRFHKGWFNRFQHILLMIRHVIVHVLCINGLSVHP